ncbi:hypothetical protein DVH24_015215 [Malus domestica]|uniref:Uncharacterized GPI-anchored protein At5g19230-like domain-containing protein n=2 Tax=Malus domestica TaxID=3750 RepID=A0A498K333_MALDO|nr:hypothetical protein DVH24_015215 [Malus domestica]
MASLIELSCFFFVIAHSFLLLSPLVQGADKDEDNLLQGINSYRTSLNLPALVKNGHCPSTKTMASSKLSYFLFYVLGLLFLSHPVFSNDEEDKLFQSLNNFRQSQKLPEFKKNDNAACLADKLADKLEHRQCSSSQKYSIEPGNGPKFPKFDKLRRRCHIETNSTTAGIIWPVCVPDLDEDLVLNNYTRSHYAKYLKDSKYAGVGIGSEDDWVIVVLTTDAQSGSFASGAASLGAIGMIHYMAAVLVGLFLVLLC